MYLGDIVTPIFEPFNSDLVEETLKENDEEEGGEEEGSGSVKKEAKGEKERKVPDEGSEGSLMNRPT
uniref:Uncharacterized protein n=1 Tax=Vespula pensylvanica TaxID=30213 RepID=A0A834NWH3_VESPE|nr:hypothetical protein H0235_010135 [Vespula pensylvanica]